MTARVADLSVTVTATPVTTVAGGTVTATVRVLNSGPDPATAVRVSVVPTALTTSSAVTSEGTLTATTWDLGTLAAGTQTELVLTLAAPTPATATLTAEVIASGVKDPDSTPGNGVSTEDDRATAAVTITTPIVTPPAVTTPIVTPPAVTPPVITPPVVTPPALTLTKASLSRTTFRPKGVPGTRKVGTAIRFTVSVKATTVVTITRKKGTRFVPAGKLTFTAGPGQIRRFFDGRIKQAPLTPGAYRLRIKAVAGNKSATSRRLPFTIAAR